MKLTDKLTKLTIDQIKVILQSLDQIDYFKIAHSTAIEEIRNYPEAYSCTPEQLEYVINNRQMLTWLTDY